MKADSTRLRFDSPESIDHGLAAWLGWFSREPFAANMAELVEQLEAAYLARAPREPVEV